MTGQLTTFLVGENLYGIEVMKVQEVTGNPAIVDVPLAPAFVRGLINLRGQIATALGLRELFGLGTGDRASQMSVVCKLEGNLVSFLVDSIGDVVEVREEDFERAPDTVPAGVRRFLKGIYKTEETLLCVLDLERLSSELSNTKEITETRSAPREGNDK